MESVLFFIFPRHDGYRDSRLAKTKFNSVFIVLSITTAVSYFHSAISS